MAEKLEVIITATDKASDVLKGLSGVATGVLTVGLAAGAAAFGALAAGLAFSVKEAMAAQEVQAQLAAVLKSTGGAAGVTADMANDLASSLSEVTRFEDDAILTGENMLLTFTNIGKEVFPDATKAILDMSTATGQDLQSSAVQLGKALNDPIQGITALTRVGVTFTEEQKKQIEAMVKAGDVAGAQKVILAELQKEFGGSAVAAGETFAGQLDILKNSLGNVAEGVGMALLPVLSDLLRKYILPLVPKVAAFAEKIGWVATALFDAGPMSSEFREALSTLIPPEIIDAITTIVGKIIDFKNILFDFITTVIIPFVTQHAEEFKGALIAIGAVLAGAAIIGGILAIAGAIAALANPITLIIGLAALIGAAWAGNWGGIQEKTQAVIAFLTPLIQGFITGIQTWWAQNGEQIIAAAKNIWDQIVAGFEFFKGIFKGVFDAFSAAFRGDWYTFGEELRKVWDTLWGKIKDIVSTAITNIKNSFKNTDWGAVGHNIIEGIANGISAALSVIKTAAINAAKAALEAAKGFLGIKSPSAVFAGIGEQMMAGMALGIQGNTAAPVGATRQAALGTVGGASSAIGRGGATFILNLTVNAPAGANDEAIATLAAVKVINAFSRPGAGSWQYAE